MRRLGRWTLNALTVLSLLLCLTTAALWVRNACADDVFVYRSLNDAGTRECNFLLEASRGRTCIECNSLSGSANAIANFKGIRELPHGASHRSYGPGQAIGTHWTSWWERIGFAVHLRRTPMPVWHQGNGLASTFGYVIVPDWSLLICLSVLPAVRGWRLVRDRRRRAMGRCTHCGYNLTGNITGVCPECGTEVAAPPSPDQLPPSN